MEIIVKPDNTPWSTLEDYGYKEHDMIPIHKKTVAKYLPTGLPIYAIAKDMEPVLIQQAFQLEDHLLPCIPIDSWNNYMQRMFQKNSTLKQDVYQDVPCATISFDDFETLIEKNSVQMPFPISSRVFVIEPIMQNQFTSSIAEGRVTGYSYRKSGSFMKVAFYGKQGNQVSHVCLPVELAGKSIFSSAIEAINGREHMSPCYDKHTFEYMDRIGVDKREYLPFSDTKQADAIRRHFSNIDLYTVNNEKEVVPLETNAEFCTTMVFIRTSDWNELTGASLPCLESSYEREDE